MNDNATNGVAEKIQYVHHGRHALPTGNYRHYNPVIVEESKID